MLYGLNHTVLKELDNSHDANKYCLETPATSPGSGIEAEAVFWPNKDLQQQRINSERELTQDMFQI